MLVSRQRHLDVLVREPDENFSDYCNAVKYYHRSTDLSMGEFFAQVGAGGLSLKETGILCRSLKEDGSPNLRGSVERRCVK